MSDKVEIEVLGMGCSKCQLLEQNARKAVGSLGIEAEISKVRDVNRIVSYGVMTTPALVVNGKVKSSGRIPEPGEIEEWLKG
jgi:small redox-active disulfide protein 2